MDGIKASSNVFFTDEENPIISGMPGSTYEMANSWMTIAFVSWTKPNAKDNSGSVILSSRHKPGDAFPIGYTEVTYTAEDPSGNKVTAVFTVYVSSKCVPSLLYNTTYYYLNTRLQLASVEDWGLNL